MITKQVRQANEEQARAIFHGGGKILSAGAGSGKTFVLVEHIVHLLRELKTTSSALDWPVIIPKNLSQIVLMTFTKKAAGEISVRLLKKIEELVEHEPANGDFWKIVQLNLTHINVTTIHGFCHKLLRQGHWSDLPTEFNLVSDIEFKNKILSLFDQWYEKRQESLPPLFQASSKALGNAMVEIFSSPELKIMWEDRNEKINLDSEVDTFFEQMLEIEGLNNLFLSEFDLNTNDKEKKKKWYEVLSAFAELSEKLGKISRRNFDSYQEYFLTISRFPPVSSTEISIAQKQKLEDIKRLRELLKKTHDDIDNLVDHFPVYLDWVKLLQEIYNYISTHYLDVDGFTYSDLEYFVLKGLEQSDVLEKIRKDYTYLIIDEFQDTSFIQFDIVKKIVGGDLNRLFTVGDRKQAIYGFRGGELQVFSECSRLLGEDNNYLLKNNFRSFGKIIGYNNEFFTKILRLGAGFEGIDPHSVEMEAQEIPIAELKDKGKITAQKTILNENPKDIDLDLVESERLLHELKKLLENDEFQSICVLYRKLKPSFYLIEKLQRLNVNFTAQIKIEISEDPIMKFFFLMIERELNLKDPKKLNSTLFLIKALADIIGINKPLEANLSQFSHDSKLYGISFSFHKMMFALGVSNSHASYNSDLIDSICTLANNKLEGIYQVLSTEGEKEYSCEVMNGGGQEKRIYIMSAHASKGLEFDAVLLGGVHSNGRSMGMKEMIGKIPRSFRWKKSFDQKRFFKSPFYFIESELLARKDFSESKRLLYVACTRAIKYLGYIDLYANVDGEAKALYENENSWINALRLHPGDVEESEYQSTHEKFKQISLIQKDYLGLQVQPGIRQLGVVSELSVTKLSCLAECPFKFYLKNICKIEIDQTVKKNSFNENDEEDYFYSSKERGTRLHALLSDLYVGKLQLQNLAQAEIDSVEWAYELGKTFLKTHNTVSEKLIKFSLFGQMVSGTPDLVFINQEDSVVVWDFKTGKRDELNEANYWLQLYCYGYAYAQKMQLSEAARVEIALIYLDEKCPITKSFSVKEITQLLFQEWRKTESLNQVNTRHCCRCEYQTICKKGTALS